MRITAILCVISSSEEVIDNRGSCYGDSSLSKSMWQREHLIMKNLFSYQQTLQAPDRRGGAFTRSLANAQIYLGI